MQSPFMLYKIFLTLWNSIFLAMTFWVLFNPAQLLYNRCNNERTGDLMSHLGDNYNWIKIHHEAKDEVKDYPHSRELHSIHPASFPSEDPSWLLDSPLLHKAVVILYIVTFRLQHRTSALALSGEKKLCDGPSLIINQGWHRFIHLDFIHLDLSS